MGFDPKRLSTGKKDSSLYYIQISQPQSEAWPAIVIAATGLCNNNGWQPGKP